MKYAAGHTGRGRAKPGGKEDENEDADEEQVEVARRKIRQGFLGQLAELQKRRAEGCREL